MTRIRTFRLLILLFLPIMSSVAQPTRLASFTEFWTSLKQGWDVRVTIEYAKCRLTVDSVEQKAPEAVGGMAISTYEYFARGVVRNARAYIASSETHLIGHPRYGYVLNYVRTRFYEDDEVEIVARYLKPTTHEVVMDETFYGRLSNGADGHGVHVYADACGRSAR